LYKIFDTKYNKEYVSLKRTHILNRYIQLKITNISRKITIKSCIV
jgi:hypothetical protein